MRIYAALLLWLAGSASAGNVSMCFGLTGPPISTGSYSAKSGETVALLAAGADLHGIVVVRGQALRFSGPAPDAQQANLPLESGRGVVTACSVAPDLVAVVVIVDGGLHSGPVVYQRD